MTPQAKARQLINRFIEDGLHGKYMGITSARQCALILVDECLKTCVESMIYYWIEVKKELEKS